MRPGGVRAICFHDRRMFISRGTTVIVWDMTRKIELKRINMRALILHVNISDDGETLFVACADYVGRVFEVETDATVSLQGHTGPVRSVIPCEDTDAFSCSEDKTIRRWNRLTGQRIRVYDLHQGEVNSILYDKRTKWMISASSDTWIIVWNAETGESITRLGKHNDSAITMVWLNPSMIVSGGADNVVRIWNFNELKEVKAMSSHTDSVYCVSATADGEFVVSGSRDFTMKVWKVATGECIATLSHHSNTVDAVAVSPDGRFIASGGGDSHNYLIQVTPPFPFIVREGNDCRLISDGRLLRYSNQMPEANNSDNSDIRMSQEWNEEIVAVRHNLALRPEKRSYSSEQVIARYRFDLVQVINFLSKRGGNRLFFPKDVVEVIGKYLTMEIAPPKKPDMLEIFGPLV
jgi:hypothetical protein